MANSSDKIILNFLPRKGGGGLQNVLSFLHILCEDKEKRDSFVAVVRSGTTEDKLCKSCGIEVIEVKNNLISRLLFELTHKKHFSFGQSCFTFWGPPMLGSKGYLVNIVGCALSNLFYPEINFWGQFPFLGRQKKELKDIYRRKIFTCPDYWIFETPILAKRAVELCGFPAERVGVVKMTASALVSPEKIKPKRRGYFEKLGTSCGWNYHG